MTEETTKEEKLLRRKAGILIHARRRPHKTIRRPLLGGKIITALIKLKGSGLTKSTSQHFTWDRCHNAPVRLIKTAICILP